MISSYAVVAADGAGPRPVVGDSNAGSRPDGKLKTGTYSQIEKTDDFSRFIQVLSDLRHTFPSIVNIGLNTFSDGYQIRNNLQWKQCCLKLNYFLLFGNETEHYTSLQICSKVSSSA